ncbi:MAG: hypothetical protein LDL07_10185 [Desulfarculus sp.]|nr:hypothetical protein [Desulfarculus sp.]
MSTGRPWLPWYPADIFSDAKYLVLSRSAKLTYRELLDRCWMAGACLPDDPRKLAALAGMDPISFTADWQEMQDPGDPCFIPHPERPGFLTNGRVLLEWNKAEDIAETARVNGKRGGRPKKINTGEKTKPVISGYPRENPTPNPEKSHSQSQSQSQEEKTGEDKPPLVGQPADDGQDALFGDAAAAPKKTQAVPHSEIIALYHEVLPELPRVATWPPHRKALLRARCREDSARADPEWWRRFFSEQVRGSPFLMGQVRDFKADLEWLLSPKNFAKVLDGRYLDRSNEQCRPQTERQRMLASIGG